MTQRLFRHFTLIAILLLAVAGSRVGAANPASAADMIQWPLDRSGARQTTLTVPFAYGTGDTKSREFSAAMKQNHDKFSSDAFQSLSIYATWPDLTPISADRHEFFEHGANAMNAVLTSGARSEGGLSADELQYWYNLAVVQAGESLCYGNHTPPMCYVRGKPDVKPSRFALQRIGVDFEKYLFYPAVNRSSLENRDVFFRRDAAGMISTLIRCTAEEFKTRILESKRIW